MGRAQPGDDGVEEAVGTLLALRLPHHMKHRRLHGVPSPLNLHAACPTVRQHIIQPFCRTRPPTVPSQPEALATCNPDPKEEFGFSVHSHPP